MYLLSINMWFQKLMRQFFFNIDKIIYNFISTIYDLLMSIARTSILSQADIIDLAERIYNLLVVFMVFKVTFSLIMYVVNPDDFSDKSKGIAKLGTNIIISLCLLILTPYIFSFAYELQTYILEDNAIAALLFGDELDNSSFLNTAGDEMAFIAIMPFFSINLSIEEFAPCARIYDDDGTISDECFDAIEYDGTGKPYIRYYNEFGNYHVGINNRNFSLIFREDLAVYTTNVEYSRSGNVETEEVFVMDYKYIFSTIVGIIIVLLLLSFCLDVAVRSVKLAFLQLIAPIPILSYVDPKSGKDGLFKKWYQMCFSTYLSLFIRLLALYFAIYIIGRIDSMVDIVDGSTVTNFIIKIFIMIGALMFAKQLPNILKNLGVKLDGDGSFNLNPLKKLEKDMFGGKVLSKPNTALSNFAKGGFGAKTIGKKIISGANAAYHGKGFKNGAKRHKGGFGKWLDKQREEYLPYGVEVRKKRAEGREEAAAMNSKWHKGLGIYQNLAKKGYDLDGDNVAAYETAGFKGEFLRSKFNLDKKSEELKKLRAEVQAKQTQGTATEEDFISLDRLEKTMKGLEAIHDSNRKVYQDQAAIEDAYKFVKYNEINPVTGEKRPEIKIQLVPQQEPMTPLTQYSELKPNTEQVSYDRTYTTESGIQIPESHSVPRESFGEKTEKTQDDREVRDILNEIDSLLETSESMDEKIQEKLDSLKKELEGLIFEKEKARDQKDIDDINRDIEKVKAEINKILGKL